jgi:splicing factor 3A subunit 1
MPRESKRPTVKAPISDQFTVEPPRNLSQLDLDIIKHTASFVAKNGKKFLVALTEREKQNPQFEFLRPTHDLF